MVVGLVLKKILFSELEDYPIIKSMIFKKKNTIILQIDTIKINM